MMRTALVLLVFAVMPASAWAQDLHVLSKEVQALALQPPLRASLAKTLGFRLTTEPVRLTPDDLQSLVRYLDVLSAVDVLAAERAKNADRRGPQEPSQDLRVVFAAICFWPNKPPVNAEVTDQVQKLRPLLAGSYHLPKKRVDIMNAARTVLLKGSYEDVTAVLAKGPAQEYWTRILDVREIK